MATRDGSRRVVMGLERLDTQPLREMTPMARRSLGRSAGRPAADRSGARSRRPPCPACGRCLAADPGSAGPDATPSSDRRREPAAPAAWRRTAEAPASPRPDLWEGSRKGQGRLRRQPVRSAGPAAPRVICAAVALAGAESSSRSCAVVSTRQRWAERSWQSLLSVALCDGTGR